MPSNTCTMNVRIGRRGKQGISEVATDISGSRGLLGDDYPGYYPVGDAQGLSSLLLRAESEATYLAQLKEHCVRLRPRFTPEGERAAWRELPGSVLHTR